MLVNNQGNRVLARADPYLRQVARYGNQIRMNPAKSAFAFGALAAGTQYAINKFGRKSPSVPYVRKSKNSSLSLKDNNNRVSRRPTYRYKKKYIPKTVYGKVRKIQKKLNQVTQKVNSGMGRLTMRTRSCGRVVSLVNQQTLYNLAAVHLNYIESVLAELRYYDPAAPTTLVQASALTGSYSKQYRIRVFTDLVFRNNYQVPCKVSLYLCKPKANTNTDPATAVSQGLADVGNPSTSSTLVYVTDSPQFKDLWTVILSKKCTLTPGAEMDLKFSTPSFVYDPSYADSNTESYQRTMNARAVLVRVEGILGHDSSVTTEQGFLAAGVDFASTRVAKVEYQAGADIEYIIATDSSSSFTNGGLVSSMPIVDNQAYSVS